jgi:hypothetical protein
MVGSVETAIESVPGEIWSQRLQRRVLRLLLQYNEQLFRGEFSYFFVDSALPQIPLLQYYDRYLKLQALSNALLDDIMPRIRRQLSLKTSHARLSEEAPTRGDIDWQRTIERNWDLTPGQPAMQFETRLRQHTMDTPENLLTVAILLAFRRELQEALLDNLEDEEFNVQEKQALTSVGERIERELAASYARVLLYQAEQIDIPRLVLQIAVSMRPGPNPYRDLLGWWERFSQFRVGSVIGERTLTLVSKRRDQNADAWLYELWIALESIHMFYEEGRIQTGDITIATDTLQCVFTWQHQRFRLLYHRQLDSMPDLESDWEHGPSTRPDYIIEREKPLQIPEEGPVVWREPPVVFEANYYLSGIDPDNTYGPLKKLLGDMALLEAHVGALFSSQLPGPQEGRQVTRIVKRSGKQYERDVSREVHLYNLQPAMPVPELQSRLRAIFGLAVQHLPERPAPVCQGAWIDEDSINATRFTLPARTILCPKPHVGPGVFDLVNVDTDCLKNPRLCHVMGQMLVPPFVARVTTKEQLVTRNLALRQHNAPFLQQLEDEKDEVRAEQIRQQIFMGMGRIIEQYVRVFGNTRQTEEKLEKWVFGQYWKKHPRCLAQTTRDTLVSGECIWEQMQDVAMQDWSAPAIQFCRALEFELKRRFYSPHPTKFVPSHIDFTLGTIPYAYANQQTHTVASTNWSVCIARVRQSRGDAAKFEEVVKLMHDKRIGKIRNDIAHGSKIISKSLASDLRHWIIGDRDNPGILCWLAEHIDV